MAPIKFEEDIKEKFEGRSIPPSPQVWEKISGQITTTHKTTKKGFAWYAIAASVIGLLIAMLVFFNAGKEAMNQEKPVVFTPQNRVNKELPQSKEELIEIIGSSSTIANAKEPYTSTSKNKVTPNNNEANTAQNKAALAIDKVVHKPKLQLENKTNLAMDVLIDQKINLVVAQVDALALQNATVSDAEIDALLRKAQEEILRQKLFTDSNSVDALALLHQAETELDLSVRDQLFETLKNGYLKVRTALADRNK
ncbi:hypothetical protein [Cellulophaga sp. Hel_I_12]|uniref:hypothetical protein n=1 Tax=Cellulophaga sp. Hel_I_12 TaxID=1249972 RepID=UPI00064604D5|nr:hypothetical protein [Cellulophaga sp. Hel_I_12]